MYPIEKALLTHELIVLRVIGEWWELDLTGQDKVACARTLARVLPSLNLSEEIEYMPPEEAEAFQELMAAGGRMPVAAFSRSYGEVRLMGPGRLEQEEPWYDPTGAAESLWYRGFIFRGFDETAEGVIEFYYLPDELMAQFAVPTAVSPVAPLLVIRDAPENGLMPVATPDGVETAVTDAVDDLTTLLAQAQRTSLQDNRVAHLLLDPHPERLGLLLTLGHEMGILRPAEIGYRPTRTAVDWLKLGREEQLRALIEAWSASSWSELHHTPGLICEGEGWQNDPLVGRTSLLDVLPRQNNWYALADLVNFMKVHDPDFQRPDGNYDTWYVRETTAVTYLTGFAQWDRVEGRLLRFLLQGPMRWLGMIDVADSPAGMLFCLTDRALAWLENRPVSDQEVRVPLVVQADGSILVPFNGDRYQRFQVARISEAAPVERGKPYLYFLTPSSLALAQEQGIAAERVLQFLESASGRPLPPGVRRSVQRWAEKGVEGRLETAVILRVRDAAIIETLSSNPKTRDFLGERLGDLAIAIRAQDWQGFRQATAQLGLLLDITIPIP